jgi:hypothetical protein
MEIYGGALGGGGGPRELNCKEVQEDVSKGKLRGKMRGSKGRRRVLE